VNIPRPIGEAIGNSSPAIEAYMTASMMGSRYKYVKTFEEQKPAKETYAPFCVVSSGIVEVLSLECFSGDFKRFEEPNSAIIYKSVADVLFSDSEAVGSSIVLYDQIRDTLQVVAVFQDLPENCSFKSGVFSNIGDAYMDYEGEWSFYYFYKLNSPYAKSDIEQQADKLILEKFKDNGNEITKEDNIVVLEAFSNLYYSPYGNMGQTGNRALMLLLTSIAWVIILIAVINYINFFMALVPIRIRNININKVFGTPTSALRLNIIGEAVGLLLLSFSSALLLVELVSDTFINELISTSLKLKENLFIVSMTGILVVLIGVLAGLFPAFYITKFNPAFVLKGSFGRNKQGRRLRNLLVIFQFTISMLLIIGSSFVYLQSHYMQKYNYGFNRDRLATVWVDYNIASQPQTFLSELRKNPAIEEVELAQTDIVNIGMKWGMNFKEEHIEFYCCRVSWHYPEFMGLKLKEGRFFNEEDALKIAGALIFNETAANKYNLKVRDILGWNVENYPMEIVGIVEDFNFGSLQQEIEPFALYEPGTSGYLPSNAHIRLSPAADFKQTADFITSCMKEISPDIETDKIKITPFDATLENLYTKEINLTKIISLFSLVAIIISLMGVFGIVVFENQHRRKEIALRKIHGSTAMLILGMFNRKFIYILLISFVIAAPIAYFGVVKWLSGFAYRTPIYGWVFAAGFLVVALITLLTVTLQTLSVANENPIRAIKAE
jgi:putative ABC transport system permease protein